MPTTSRLALRRAAAVLLLATAWGGQALGQSTEKKAPVADKASRAQLSIGYSLLFQEADGLPKLNWLLRFKDKSQEMGRMTEDLVSYYQHLAESLKGLSMQYPAVRLDVKPMSDIEGNTRKAIGEDLAKDLAPLIGKSGTRFEREALLMFYDTLNEQRHLVGVMLGLETAPALRKFLETTKAQMETRYLAVEQLLDHRYFTP